MGLIDEQKIICDKYGSPYLASPQNLKVGISMSVEGKLYPINGLRHPPESDTTGWYIWAGEYSDDPDFFVPLHVEHLGELCPEVLKYLGFSPGWRFLIAPPSYEDVWEDKSLLDI